MGPLDCELIKTYISQATAFLEKDTVKRTDNNLVAVLESEFGGAFPTVPTVVTATIVNRSQSNVIFNSGFVSITPTPPGVRTEIPLPPTPFASAAPGDICELIAFLSANVNPAFDPDASYATSVVLVIS